MDPVSASRAPYNFGNSKHWESESKKARDARQAELDRLDNQLAALGRARQKLDLAETCYMAVQEYRCHIRFEQMGRAEATLNRARTAAARLARLDSYSTPHGLSVDSKAGDAKRALARLESALSPSVSESPSPAGPRGRGVDNEEAVETRIRGTR